MAQRTIHRERIRRDVRLEALRQHHLIDIARGDVFFRLAHLLLEPLAREIRPNLEAVRRLVARPREIPLELALEKPDLRDRELIKRFEIVVGGDPRVGDDQDAVLDVVERQHGVEQHETRLVGAVGAFAEIAEHRLEPRRSAVSEVSNCAAGEARQVGHERRSDVGHQPSECVDERLLARDRRSAAIDGGAAVARAQNQKRILAEKRVSADMLAALDALEQERVVRVLGDLQEGRNRRQQVGDDLLADRNEGSAPRQFLELLKRRNSHRVQTPPSARAPPRASPPARPSRRSTTGIARVPARPACRARRSSRLPPAPRRAAVA